MGADDVLRVSVVEGHDRVDLVVPAAVDVAELLPELVRRLGGDQLADLRLSVLGGPRLAAGSGLGAQGVADGAILTLTPESAHHVPVDDDLTSVVAEVVEDVPGAAPGVAHQALLAVAATLLGLAALGVLLVGSPTAAAASAAASLLLLGVAGAVGRGGHRDRATGVASWLAVAHAGAAGAVAGLTGAGASCLLVGTLAAVVTRRPVLWAATVAGTVLVATGVVGGLTDLSWSVAATGALALVVLTGDLVPWLAATVAGLVPPPLGEPSPTVPDRDRVTAAVRRAHDVLLVCAVATGLLLVALAPLLVVRGWWGVATALLCCAVVGLRSRRHRVGSAGAVTLVAALAALVPLAAAVWWHGPGWRLEALAAALGLGVVLLAVAGTSPPHTPRAGRVAELAEALALAALPPVLLAATGVLDVVRELVG